MARGKTWQFSGIIFFKDLEIYVIFFPSWRETISRYILYTYWRVFNENDLEGANYLNFGRGPPILCNRNIDGIGISRSLQFQVSPPNLCLLLFDKFCYICRCKYLDVELLPFVSSTMRPAQIMWIIDLKWTVR